MNNFLNNTAKICFYLFFAVLPFRIGTFLFTPNLYDGGFFNPYTGYFLHLSEVFLIAGLLCFFGAKIFEKKKKSEKVINVFKGAFLKDSVFLLFSVFVLFSVFSLVFSVDVKNSLLYVVRFIELLIVYKLITCGFLNFYRIMGIFVGVMFAQSIIAILQYYLQSDLGMQFFGEPVLSLSAKGIASFDWGGEKIIRAYGTFSHPNLLGMYMVFAFWFLVFLSSRIKDRLVLICLGFLFLSALFFSFSRSAWLAFFLSGIVFLFFRDSGKGYVKYLAGLFIVLVFSVFVSGIYEPLIERVFGVFTDTAFAERLRLMEVSLKILADNLFGVGVGNFTLVMQEYELGKLFPWNYQPVHNIFLLSFSEAGLLGGLSFAALFVWSLIKSFSNKEVFVPFVIGVCVLVAALFDHYLFTFLQGQVLLVMFFALAQKGTAILKDDRTR